MGIEYRLEFPSTSKIAVRNLIASLQGAEVTESAGVVELRHEASSVGVPDATAIAEDYGLYFCDNGGQGRAFLGHVLARLVGEFGAIRITEIE